MFGKKLCGVRFNLRLLLQNGKTQLTQWKIWKINMKLQDCFIGQNVGVNSKSKGVIVGTVSSMFETKDVDTEEAI